MSDMIEIKQLNKAFRKSVTKRGALVERLDVLSHVTLSVKKNEFVSLLGPSGCGKSTLLKLIAGLDKDYEGVISLSGLNPQEGRIPVCYMLQKDCLMPWRNMLDNILLPIEIRKGDLKSAKEEIKPLISEFGLSGFENYRPHQLSGGMRQRAALLRTYLMEGDIMLLDEPFGALDEITRIQLQDWLISIWERHLKTVLFVTHNVDEAIYLSDRILVMSSRPGTIKGEITLSYERPRVRDRLLGPEFLEYKRSIMQLLSQE